MLEENKEVVRKLAAVALSAVTVLCAGLGLTALSMDNSGDNFLEDNLHSISTNIQKNISLTGSEDKPLTKSDLGVSTDIDNTQIFMKKGSTLGDYCLAGRNSYNTDGLTFSHDKLDLQPATESPCDGADMELVLGEETIENFNSTEATAHAVLGIGAGGAVGLSGMGIMRWRRKDQEWKEWIATTTEPLGNAIAANRIAANEVGTPSITKDVPKQVRVEPAKNITTAGSPSSSVDPRVVLQRKMEEIILLWSEYETDPVKVLDYPMISNMGFAPTSNFHLSMLRTKNAFNDGSDIQAIRSAVTEFEHSYNVMISEAQRMKWNTFSVEEQKHLRTAQQLLNMAMDSSSSPNERNMAYKKLLKEVEGIITLSPTTILEIEARSMLGISGKTSSLPVL